MFWAASTTARKRTKPASSGVDVVERDLVRARLELDALDADLFAVREQPDGRRLGDGRMDVRDHLDGLAEARGRRRREALDQDLRRRSEADDPRLDLDSAGRRESRFRLALSGRVVSVGEQHDSLLGVVREECGGEPKRRSDVGGGTDRGRGDPVDLAELGRKPFDQCALAEAHDPRRVALGHERQALADERERLLAAGLANRVGQVDDKDGRQAIDRQDEPEPSEREDKRGQQQGADDQCDSTPARARPSPSRCVEREGQAESREQEEQRERRVEGDAHVRHSLARAAGPGSRRRAKPSSRRRGGTAPIRRTGRPGR